MMDTHALASLLYRSMGDILDRIIDGDPEMDGYSPSLVLNACWLVAFQYELRAMDGFPEEWCD